MSDFTEAQKQELVRLKQYFPFRVVYGAINPATGEFEAQAHTTKRRAMRRAREGWAVWLLS